LFFVLSRTGLRLGEALALRWDDIDLVAREVRVERARGHGRTVGLGASTCELLRKLRAAEAKASLKLGRACPGSSPRRTASPCHM
jgi:integrase